MITVRVQREPFSPEALLEPLETLGGGAVASFTGLVRHDDGVSQLTLEHYPGMTERALETIALKAVERWSLLGAVIVHRVGPLTVGDRIVFVATAAPHRQDALAACAHLIDRLKTDAPFWKREMRGERENWVEPRETDEIRTLLPPRRQPGLDPGLG